MNDEAKIPLVMDMVEPFQRLHGDSAFEGGNKPWTEDFRDTLAVSGRMRQLMRG